MNRSKGNRGGGRPAGHISWQELRASSDERLAELVVAGDDAAFEVLFDRHVADALWFAREALGTWKEAEEAVRHSFAAAKAYLAARGDDVEFEPWLRTILGNHCLSIAQARLAGSRPDPGPSQVTHLDEWRRRRRDRRAALLPLGPTAGVPFLGGGTAAKVAVVAALAGGVGVTGQVASELPEPSARSAPPPAVVVKSAVTPAVVPVAQEPVPATARPRVEQLPEAKAKAEVDSRTGSPPPVGADVPVPPPSPPPPAQLDSSTVRVDDSVVAAPATGPEPIDLAAIGDDLGVDTAQLPVDVDSLLTRVGGVLKR